GLEHPHERPLNGPLHLRPARLSPDIRNTWVANSKVFYAAGGLRNIGAYDEMSGAPVGGDRDVNRARRAAIGSEIDWLAGRRKIIRGVCVDALPLPVRTVGIRRLRAHEDVEISIRNATRKNIQRDVHACICGLRYGSVNDVASGQHQAILPLI